VPTVPVARSGAAPSIVPSVRTLSRLLSTVFRVIATSRSVHRGVFQPRRVWRSLVVSAALVVPLTTHAQRGTTQAQRDACDPAELEVRTLDFVGNRAFSNGQLASVIALTASKFRRRLLIGTPSCGNPALVAIDRARLVIYYRRRGYPDVQVDTAVQRVRRVMDLRFTIREGAVTTIDTVRIAGLERIDERERLSRNLPVSRGGAFDQYLLEQTRDTLRRRLADVGYPFARVLLNTDVLRGSGADSTRRTAVVEFSVNSGPAVTIGNVVVQAAVREGKPQQIPSDVVRTLVGMQPGDRFEQSDVERATRALYLTDAYQQVRIEPRFSDSLLTADSARVDMLVNVAERFMHSRTVGAGFGTLDCFRTQLQYIDRNFLRRARRLELTARLSKIGVGSPVKFDGAGSLCNAVTENKDPYSNELNYYVGATLRPPVGPGGLRIPEVTLYSEKRGEYQAYRRTTLLGAIASVTLQARPRLPVTLAYDLSFGNTEAQPALFCSVLNRCAPADREVFEKTRRLAVLGANFTRDRTDDPINPRSGNFTRLALRHASPLTLSDSAFRFSSAVLDAGVFFGLGAHATLAMRVQLGAVFGSNEKSVPPQERLYAGGPTTVRGFRQNELGPVAYVVSPDTATQQFIRVPISDTTFSFEVNPAVRPFRIVPVGGNTVAVGNIELRLRSPFLPTLVQWTLFSDFGQVWNRGGNDASLRDNSLRITPGVGARVYSPIGVIRLDLGYNNYPQRAGAAYFNELPSADGTTRALLCVSPGNGIGAREDAFLDANGALQKRISQAKYASCRGSYQPARNRGILGPLTFFFAIGQAF
jgi:outer membrane protein assembly complex protein YaeT